VSSHGVGLRGRAQAARAAGAVGGMRRPRAQLAPWAA